MEKEEEEKNEEEHISLGRHCKHKLKVLQSNSPTVAHFNSVVSPHCDFLLTRFTSPFT